MALGGFDIHLGGLILVGEGSVRLGETLEQLGIISEEGLRLGVILSAVEEWVASSIEEVVELFQVLACYCFFINVLQLP